jgi:hypothetical protein
MKRQTFCDKRSEGGPHQSAFGFALSQPIFRNSRTVETRPISSIPNTKTPRTRSSLGLT